MNDVLKYTFEALNISLAFVLIHKLYEGRFSLDISSNFFTEKMIKHWNELLRLVVFKRRLDVALSGVVDKVMLVQRLDLILQKIFPT